MDSYIAELYIGQRYRIEWVIEAENPTQAFEIFMDKYILSANINCWTINLEIRKLSNGKRLIACRYDCEKRTYYNFEDLTNGD
jgi:hypothetical protein